MKSKLEAVQRRRQARLQEMSSRAASSAGGSCASSEDGLSQPSTSRRNSKTGFVSLELDLEIGVGIGVEIGASERDSIDALDLSGDFNSGDVFDGGVHGDSHMTMRGGSRTENEAELDIDKEAISKSAAIDGVITKQSPRVEENRGRSQRRGLSNP